MLVYVPGGEISLPEVYKSDPAIMGVINQAIAYED
jgi:hypothetical protein